MRPFADVIMNFRQLLKESCGSQIAWVHIKKSLNVVHSL